MANESTVAANDRPTVEGLMWSRPPLWDSHSRPDLPGFRAFFQAENKFLPSGSADAKCV